MYVIYVNIVKYSEHLKIYTWYNDKKISLITFNVLFIPKCSSFFVTEEKNILKRISLRHNFSIWNLNLNEPTHQISFNYPFKRSLLAFYIHEAVQFNNEKWNLNSQTYKNANCLQVYLFIKHRTFFYYIE